MIGESAATRRAGRLAGGWVFAALLTVYLATLAPRVTFWDAGEFIAAIERWGVPHPPGTPLYVTLGRAWRVALGFLPAAVAVNALSAACTAAACALVAAVLGRRLGSAGAGAAAGITAGAMSSVWLSATEAEVYSAALLLAAAMLAVGLRAGDEHPSRAGRTRTLLGYLFALAAPLHASALVAAPAAAFASVDGEVTGATRWRTAASLGVALVAAGAVATGRWWLAAVALVVLAVLSVARFPIAARLLGVVVLGASPLAIMLLRAHFDPAIDQGNPVTIAALADVVARKQYEVASLWPRQAPVWLQLANFFQYADWQVALGVAPDSRPSVPRLAFSLAFVALGVLGARAQRARDRRGFRALLALVLSASVGVVVYLNLKAGPSIGWGILPDAAPHEARERDYFFALAFWAWGLWAGLGAMVFARRLTAGPRALALGVALAALPVVLDWRAMNRRREPDASTAAMLADGLLGSAPANAVLVVWGDNDSYPLWEAQQARGMRRDVLVVTTPLLGADWQRAELVRRAGIDPGPVASEMTMVRAVAREARARGRPLAFAVTVPARVREGAGRDWRRCGLAWVERGAGCAFADSAAIARFVAAHPPSAATDGTVRAMLGALRCGGSEVRQDTVHVATDSLAPSCNAR